MSRDHRFIEECLETACLAAREAGALLLSRFRGRLEVRLKGEIDLVTDADRASEDLLVDRLGRAFPDHAIVTEEGGGRGGTSPYAWIVDPLDGTTNFAHGFPFFCVSIALARGDQVQAGAVFDPVREELFTAVRGAGARLNGKAVSVSETASLDRSLLATGFPYDIRRARETNLDYFGAFAVRAQAIRRAGSAALDLCYVADGRFDGYWEITLKPWDMAAGSLLVTEAGGRVTDLAGEPHTTASSQVAASNGLIHRSLLDVIAEVRRSRGPNGD